MLMFISKKGQNYMFLIPIVLVIITINFSVNCYQHVVTTTTSMPIY